MIAVTHDVRSFVGGEEKNDSSPFLCFNVTVVFWCSHSSEVEYLYCFAVLSLVEPCRDAALRRKQHRLPRLCSSRGCSERRRDCGATRLIINVDKGFLCEQEST